MIEHSLLLNLFFNELLGQFRAFLVRDHPAGDEPDEKPGPRRPGDRESGGDAEHDDTNGAADQCWNTNSSQLKRAQHTSATPLLAQGVHPKVVQERLGHADPDLRALMVREIQQGNGGPPRTAADQVRVAIDAFADADTTSPIADLIATLCPAKTVNGRRYRALRAWDPEDLTLVTAVADGANTKEIAAALSISVKTVERHRSNLMDKLNAHNLVELIRIGIRHGLIRLDD